MPTVHKPPEEILQSYKCMGVSVTKHLYQQQSELNLTTRIWNLPKILTSLSGKRIGQLKGSPAKDYRWIAQYLARPVQKF